MEVLIWVGATGALIAAGLLVGFSRHSIKWGTVLVLVGVAIAAAMLLIPDSCSGR